jgi:hypothetical protein
MEDEVKALRHELVTMRKKYRDALIRIEELKNESIKTDTGASG